MASKEDIYIGQLKALGIWKEAFRSVVHDLAVLEREQTRTRKAWKATAEDGKTPSPLDDHYQLILQQGAAIARLRDELGLTPKSLRRIRGEFDAAVEPVGEKPPTVLELVRSRQRKQA